MYVEAVYGPCGYAVEARISGELKAFGYGGNSRKHPGGTVLPYCDAAYSLSQIRDRAVMAAAEMAENQKIPASRVIVRPAVETENPELFWRK